MKRLLMALALCVPLAAGAEEGAKMAASEKSPYPGSEYFFVTLPAGWRAEDLSAGLSQEEKKVFGVNAFGPVSREGVPSRVAAHYYAPGNLLHRTYEKFIRTHSKPVLGGPDPDKKYGPVSDSRAGGRPAKVFERKIVQFVPPDALKPVKVPVYEKFVVVPAGEGFFVLRFYSAVSDAKANSKAFEELLKSFKPLAK